MSERQHTPFERPPRIHDEAQLGEAWQKAVPDAKTRQSLLDIGIPHAYQHDPEAYLIKIGDVDTFINRMQERQDV